MMRLPPGVPMTITGLPSFETMVGVIELSGRLPGATEAATDGSAQDCEPREEGHSPVPGITGVVVETSLGVAEKVFP